MTGQDPIGPRPAPVLTTATVRVELARFAEAMEAKLKANDHKASPNTQTTLYHLVRLRQELDELAEALIGGNPVAIQDECCDVAAFASFIWGLLDEERRAEHGGTP